MTTTQCLGRRRFHPALVVLSAILWTVLLAAPQAFGASRLQFQSVQVTPEKPVLGEEGQARFIVRNHGSSFPRGRVSFFVVVRHDGRFLQRFEMSVRGQGSAGSSLGVKFTRAGTNRFAFILQDESGSTLQRKDLNVKVALPSASLNFGRPVAAEQATQELQPADIQVNYDPGALLPDLVVEELTVVDNEARFSVRNIGRARKEPGTLRYRLEATYDHGSTDHQGVAGMTSLASIRSREVGPEDRAAGHSIDIRRLVELTLCLNPDRSIEERNYSNNCRTVSAAPTRRWNVVLSLEQIEVSRDGDSASPGDWIVGLVGNGGERMRWPDEGTRNVDSGTTVAVQRALKFRNLRDTDGVEFHLAVVDCDSGGAIGLDVVPGMAAITSLGGLLHQATCGGEEFWEVSGGHDATGISVNLNPGDWSRGGERTYRLAGSGLEMVVRLRLQPEAWL